MSTPTRLALTDEALRNRYQIIETDDGLQISESRVLLFDVMEAYDEGDSIYEISKYRQPVDMWRDYKRISER